VSKKSKRNAILLLGMHRSGTSAATRIFSLLGYDLPKSLMGVNESNPVGHWESDAIVVLNDILLKEVGASWDSWQYFTTDEYTIERKKDIIDDIGRHLRLEFPGKKDFILKDPRISRLTNLYLESFADNEIIPNVVMSIRNPLSVADSLQKRDKMPKGDAAMLWLRYVLDAEYGSRGQNRAFFSYEDMLSDSPDVLKQISKSLDLTFPLTVESVKSQLSVFLDEGMQHHKRTAEELVLDPVMRGWVDRAYSLLMGLCTAPHDSNIQDELDTIRGELDHISPIMKKLQDDANDRHVLEKERELKEVIAEQGDAKSQLEALEQGKQKQFVELTRRVNAAEHKNNVLTAREAESSAKNAELTKRVNAAEAKNKAMAEREAKSAANLVELTQRVNDAEHFKKTLSDKFENLIKQRTHEKLDDAIIAREIYAQKSQLAATRKNIGHLEQLRDVKQEQLQTALDEKTELQAQVKDLENRLEQNIGEASQLSKTLEQKGRELSERVEEEARLKALLSEREKAEAALTQKISDLQKAETTLKEKLGENEKITEELKHQNTRDREVISTLREEISGLSEDISSLKTTNADQANKLKTLQSESDEFLAKNFDLKVDIQTLQAQLEKEKRSVFRPAIRRTRNITGRILRVILPSSYVTKIAQKIPSNDKPLKLISGNVKVSMPKRGHL